MVNHPVHMITKDNKTSPSAFIPFCEFGGNISVLSLKIDKFQVPVCNSFDPKLHNDQLCYEVDLNRYSNKNNIQMELELGFNFIMDYNYNLQWQEMFWSAAGWFCLF